MDSDSDGDGIYELIDHPTIRCPVCRQENVLVGGINELKTNYVVSG